MIGFKFEDDQRPGYVDWSVCLPCHSTWVRLSRKRKASRATADPLTKVWAQLEDCVLGLEKVNNISTADCCRPYLILYSLMKKSIMLDRDSQEKKITASNLHL